MSKRGWLPDSLPQVPMDGRYWTLAEAASVLDLNQTQATMLRAMINCTHVFPVGRRKSTVPARPPGDKYYSSKGGKAGRMAKVYPADQLIELVELLGLNGPKYVKPEPVPAAPRSGRSRRASTSPPAPAP